MYMNFYSVYNPFKFDISFSSKMKTLENNEKCCTTLSVKRTYHLKLFIFILMQLRYNIPYKMHLKDNSLPECAKKEKNKVKSQKWITVHHSWKAAYSENAIVTFHSIFMAG